MNFEGLDIEIAYLKDFPQFVEELSILLHNEFGIYPPGGSLEQRKLRLLRYMQKKSIPVTFIALINGRLAGTASLIDYDMDNYKYLTPWLASVYTISKFRRKGIASTLIRRVLKEAKDLGVDKLYLFTEKLVLYFETFGWKKKFDTEYKGRIVTIMYNELSKNTIDFLNRNIKV